MNQMLQVDNQSSCFVPLLVVQVKMFDQIFVVSFVVLPFTPRVIRKFFSGKMLHQLMFIALPSVFDMIRTVTSMTMMFNQSI
jgi:hypothetical protein